MIAPILELVGTCQGKLLDVLKAAASGHVGDVEIEITNEAGPNIVLKLETSWKKEAKVAKKVAKKKKKKVVRKKTSLRKKKK